MSLINQVLKDLEQRHASEMADATNNLDGLALASPVIPKATTHKVWLLSLVGVLLIGAAVSAWWWQRNQTQQGLQPAVAGVPTPTPVQTPTPAKVAMVTPVTPVQTQPADQQSMHASKPTVTRTKQSASPEHRSKVVHAKKMSKVPHELVAEQEPAGGMEKQMVPLRREQKAELAYQAGYDQLQLHNTRRAEQELRQALTIDASHVRARELLAGLLIRQGRWIETADLMQQGVQVLPDNTVFTKLYARTLMQLNRDQQAIKVLGKHAPPIAQDPDYYALLAALYQRQQDHLAAANTYSQILKLRPDAGIWWVGLGISLEALGKKQQAQQAYTRARQSGTLRGDLARYTDNRLLALDAINYPID